MSGDRWLWRYGDPWRQLSEIHRQDTTVVTSNGTARLLRPADGLQMRLPRLRRHEMPGDGLFHPLYRTSVATPCGLVTWATDSPFDWHATSPPIGVLVGADEGVHEEPLRSAVDALVRQFEGIIADGHPVLPCGALHCVVGVWPSPRTPQPRMGPSRSRTRTAKRSWPRARAVAWPERTG